MNTTTVNWVRVEKTRVSIVLAKREELAELGQMAAEIWWHTYPSIITGDHIAFMLARGYSEKALAEQMEFFGQELYFILDGEGQKVGFVGVLQGQQANESYLYVRKLYTATSRQGEGIGRAVVGLLQAMARAKGMNKIRLNVNRKNPAYYFYLKTGFAVLREEDIAYGPYLLEDYLMELAW